MQSKAKFTDDVLLLERMLLEKGQLPSVFFRFPALNSQKEDVLLLRDLGLIPVASDSWLAKGQKARSHSIILVHGNGNEHVGIDLATRYLAADAGMKLLPLTDAPIAEFCRRRGQSCDRRPY
jgi:hypothetical protein